MTIVSNSSPLILYAKIGRLELLHELFSEILIPPAVHEEIVIRGRGRAGASDVATAQWITPSALPDRALAQLPVRGLGQGEAEVIALAITSGRSRVLLDDRDGHRLARERGLRVVRSGGALILAKQQRMIPLVRPVLDELRDAGLYLSDGAYREVLASVGE
jgi:predicted nucleic acid-binding protein